MVYRKLNNTFPPEVPMIAPVVAIAALNDEISVYYASF
jgi:hypothetical protein